MLRGHRAKVVFAALLSAGAIVGQVLIPLLVGDAVNQIDDGDRGDLIRSAGMATGSTTRAKPPRWVRRAEGTEQGASHPRCRPAHVKLTLEPWSPVTAKAYLGGGALQAHTFTTERQSGPPGDTRKVTLHSSSSISTGSAQVRTQVPLGLHFKCGGLRPAQNPPR
jgi:hypothetical protein